MKCLIIDAVHSAISEELSKYMQVDTHMLPTQEELLKLIPDYDVLIMRVDPAINKEILDAAKNLKVIGVCSVGLNHIDLDTAKEKGIQVFNAPGLNGNAVAELTLCKMLEMSRHTIPACYDVKVNKTWDKYKFVGSDHQEKEEQERTSSCMDVNSRRASSVSCSSMTISKLSLIHIFHSRL